MTRPSTESPRNSSRSLVGRPPFSYAKERWVSACSSKAASSVTPSASSNELTREVCLVLAQPCQHVVHGLPDSREIFDVVVIDGEPGELPAHRPLDQLDHLDEGERVGLQIGGQAGVARNRR